MTQRNPIDYTHDEIIYTCAAMNRFGGAFACHIADAAMVADSFNRKTLLTAFAGLFHKYGPDSDFYKSNA